MSDRTPTLQQMVVSSAGIDANGHPPESNEAILKLLQQRRFDHTITPPPLRAIYTLNGAAISTPGNLTSVTSAVKTGKSAVIGAMKASTMAPVDGDADLLGFGSSNPKGLALLHFDSEQSPDDAWHHAARVLKRAGLHAPPEWFYSYCLTGLGCKRAWECVQEAAKEAADKHGGIHSVLLDGVADLVLDVNDPEESNSFIAILHDMAIQNDCPIIGVIHFNPGGEKTRGHLGSQLERKAETNLRLDKVKEATTIWSDKQRRAPIPKGTGPTFAWSDAAQMHVSIETLQTAADNEKRESLVMLRDELFRKRAAMSFTDIGKLLTAKKGMNLSQATADRRIRELSKHKLIEKSVVGLWIKGKS